MRFLHPIRETNREIVKIIFFERFELNCKNRYNGRVELLTLPSGHQVMYLAYFPRENIDSNYRSSRRSFLGDNNGSESEENAGIGSDQVK